MRLCPPRRRLCSGWSRSCGCCSRKQSHVLKASAQIPPSFRATLTGVRSAADSLVRLLVPSSPPPAAAAAANADATADADAARTGAAPAGAARATRPGLRGDAAILNLYWEGVRGGCKPLERGGHVPPHTACFSHPCLLSVFPSLLLLRASKCLLLALPPSSYSLSDTRTHLSLLSQDMLSGHRDDAETDLTLPIVSISLGCPGIFLIVRRAPLSSAAVGKQTACSSAIRGRKLHRTHV